MVVTSIPGKTRFSHKNYQVYVREGNVAHDEVVCVDYIDYIRCLRLSMDALERLIPMAQSSLNPTKDDIDAIDALCKAILRVTNHNVVPMDIYTRLERDFAWADSVITVLKQTV